MTNVTLYLLQYWLMTYITIDYWYSYLFIVGIITANTVTGIIIIDDVIRWFWFLTLLIDDILQ